MSYREPFVPTPVDVIPVMLGLASLKEGELVYDLGSGDGRLAIAAARDYGARVVGVEINKTKVSESRRRLRELGLSSRVKILNRNFRDVNLKDADVLALYLSSYILNSLTPKFESELKQGVRLVNFDFEVPAWKAAKVLRVRPKGWRTTHPVYLYKV